MTKAAAHYGKRLDNWLNLPSTLVYAHAISELYSLEIRDLVQTTRGRNGGTWGHPKLALKLAAWLDPRFEEWMHSVIEDILTKKAKLVVTKPQESAVVVATQNLGMNNQMMQALTMFMQASKTPHKFERVLDRASQRDSPLSPLPFPHEGRRGLSQGLQ